MYDLKSKLLYALFPKRCFLCGALITPDEYACEDCWGGISRIEPPICLNCGMGKKECTCADEKLRFSYIAAPFKYDGTVRKLLHIFKFNGETQLKELFAVHMAETAAREYYSVNFDAIISVPMTDEDVLKRGYNQGALIAKRIGELLNISYSDELLFKIEQTQKQHELTAAERRVNLIDAFKANESAVQGKTILLCDDIKTTGATLYCCTQVLKKAGAKQVYCLCAAITVFE